MVRYADDGVVLCRPRPADRPWRRGRVLAWLGLRLHPDKTRVVDLREGREGLDFLGCHFRARMSGRLWEQRGSCATTCTAGRQAVMARVRAKVRDLTGRIGSDLRSGT